MSTISSGNTSATTLGLSADATGNLVFKTFDTGNGGTTALTLDTTQKATFANGASITGNTVFNGSYTEGVVAIGNSSTATTLSLLNGTFQTVTMNGNCTFTMPTLVAGKSFTPLINTGAGSFTGVFTSVKWPSNTAPTLTTTANSWDQIAFASDGTYWYGAFLQAYA